MIAAAVRFSVRNAGLVLAIACAVLIFGIVRMFGASLDVFPEFSPTQVVIQTESPGLATDLVETLVTNPIEQAIGGVAGLKSIRSQSIPGLSVVTVIFADGSDIYRNRQLVAERLTQTANQLPNGITPTITPLTSSASTVLGVGVTSKTRSALELRSLVDWTIRPHLLSVPGVADINVFGGKVRQWQILVDPLRLAQAGLSLPELASAARQVTGVRGAGFVESTNQRISLSLESQASSAEELARAVIGRRGNRPLLLGDVARVAEGPAPSISGAQINGEPGVFLFIQGQLGANTRDTTFALERALAEIGPVLDREGVTLHPDLFRPASFIETAVGNVRQDVLIGASLVIAVLFLFLYNARTAFVSAVAIPLSLIAAVLVLQAAGMSLNIMVLGGLAIALGEVVDDAIIDCENIFRRLRENRLLAEPAAGWKVVFDASMEVRSSVVYATFIVALVFVPLLTLSGVAGKLFAPLGLAYISAILASLVVAITVTPAMSYLLLANRPLKSDDPPLIGLDQALLPPRPAEDREAPQRGTRRRGPDDGGWHRRVAAVRRRIHSAAQGRPLHRPHDGNSRHVGDRIVATGQARGRRTAEDSRREIGRSMGRPRTERRRHLRSALQRIRGRDRTTLRRRSAAHSQGHPPHAVERRRRRRQDR